MKLDIILKNHWLTLPFFIVSFFATGFQAIPVVSWSYVPLLLTYTRQGGWLSTFIAYLISGFGFGLDYLGIFHMDKTQGRFPAPWAVFVISYLVNLILLVSVVTDRMIVKRGILWTRIFFFPCVWTGLWYLFSRFGGLGDYTAFSTPLADWADLAQISSLGGRPLIDFLVSLFGTVMLETISGTPESDPLLEPDDNTEEENNENSDDDGKFAQNRSLWNQPLAWYGVLLALVFVYGGAQTNIHSGSFYQNSLTEYVPPSLPVGCVVGPGQNVVLAKNHSHWLELTENLAESGAKLILWSEETIKVDDEEQEQVFLDTVKSMATKYGIYIAVTYDLLGPVQKNKLVLIDKNGDIGIDYNKAFPVPGVETQGAGPSVLQYIDTDEFGRVGAAICFDYNFPHFIHQSSKHSVDVMLQATWTWGPGGAYHAKSNSLRAVENGFTLFRCASQSISGVFEPTIQGMYNQRVGTLNDESYIFQLPIQKRMNTLYGYIGDIFSYMCLTAAIVMLVMKKRQLQI